MKSTLCFVLLAALFANALAFPRFFPGRIDPDAKCDVHPQGTQKGHAAPEIDEEIEFTLMKGKKAVTTFCPGDKYVLTVKFSDPRRAMLTATYGSFKRNEAVDIIAKCPNRKNLSGDPNKNFLNTDTYKIMWTASCDSKIDEVTMKVTSATGATGGYLVNSATFAKGKSCKKSRKCKMSG